MARHILIVDESDMMRRVLQARILASLDDAVISEASGPEQAAPIIAKNTVHLILYNWDIQDEAGLQFCRQAAAGGKGAATPYLLLVSDKKEHVNMAAELAGSDSYLVMPCAGEDLAKAIDRVCSPVALRQSERYSIEDTRAIIEQRQMRIEAAVVNVSAGGVLCEFELDPQMNPAFTCTISISFGSGEKPVVAADIQAVVSNVLVLNRHHDQTPKRIRMGFKFVQLSAGTLDRIVQVLKQANG